MADGYDLPDLVEPSRLPVPLLDRVESGLSREVEHE